MGCKVYKRIGFNAYCDFDMYEWSSNKKKFNVFIGETQFQLCQMYEMDALT